MDEVVNKFLLAKDKLMAAMHFKKPGVTCSACGTFTKNKERIQKFKETRDSRYIYQNELDKACFQHDMAYGDFKELTRRTVSHEILHNKASNISKIIGNMMDIKGFLLQWFINFFDKMNSGGAIEN